MTDDFKPAELNVKNVSEAFAAYRTSVAVEPNDGKPKKKSKYPFASRLLIYTGRRKLVAIHLAFLVALLANIVNTATYEHLSWITLVSPTILLGLTIVLQPMSEEWEYKPWQSASEKQERTFFT